MKRGVQILIMAIVGFGALWITFKDVQWADFAASMGSIRWPIFAAGVSLFGLLHVTRSWRWALIVRGTRPDLGFRSAFSIASVGFLLINILPFRLGEFVRPYLLFEREDIPFGAGLATVLVERVLDVAALGVIFVGVLLFADLPSTSVTVGATDYDLVLLGRTAILGTLLPFGGALAVLLVMGDRGVALAGRVGALAGPRVGRLAQNFVTTFLSALRGLGTFRRAGDVLLWTGITWTINVVSMVVMARGFEFGRDFAFWDGATVLVCICVALIVPAPPGFAGIFELSVAMGLAFFGVADAPAAAFGLSVHVAQLFVLVAVGSWFLAVDRIEVRKLLAAMKTLREGDPEAASEASADGP